MDRFITYYEKSYAYSSFKNREWDNILWSPARKSRIHSWGSHLSTHAQRVTVCVYIRQLQIDARTQ